MRRCLIVLVLLIAGCSSGAKGSSPTDVVAATPVSCADHFKDGNAPVDVRWMNTPCVDAAGASHVYSAMTVECTDGRILLWNDKGWAFVGDRLTVYGPGAEQVAPVEARNECTPPVP